MTKIVAFAGAVAALALWAGPWRAVVEPSHGAAPALLAAGGLFTVAIAILIRD